MAASVLGPMWTHMSLAIPMVLYKRLPDPQFLIPLPPCHNTRPLQCRLPRVPSQSLYWAIWFSKQPSAEPVQWSICEVPHMGLWRSFWLIEQPKFKGGSWLRHPRGFQGSDVRCFFKATLQCRFQAIYSCKIPCFRLFISDLRLPSSWGCQHVFHLYPCRQEASPHLVVECGWTIWFLTVPSSQVSGSYKVSIFLFLISSILPWLLDSKCNYPCFSVEEVGDECLYSAILLPSDFKFLIFLYLIFPYFLIFLMVVQIFFSPSSSLQDWLLGLEEYVTSWQGKRGMVLTFSWAPVALCVLAGPSLIGPLGQDPMVHTC